MLLWQNCPFYRTDLQANAAVNAGGKVNPVPVCTLLVFAGAFVDAGDWAGIYAVGNPFTDVRYDGVWHIFSRTNSVDQRSDGSDWMSAIWRRCS
jgi:hypothetical protein